jgi:hypothetical protein
LHFGLAFGADSSWHTLHPSVVIANSVHYRAAYLEATKNLNRNPRYLQEAAQEFRYKKPLFLL